MSLVMRKLQLFAYAKTKTQISFAVTAKLISAFILATLIVQSLYLLYTNFKPLAIFCGSTARFKSDLVGNPLDRFSHNEAHIKNESRLSSISKALSYSKNHNQYVAIKKITNRSGLETIFLIAIKNAVSC